MLLALPVVVAILLWQTTPPPAIGFLRFDIVPTRTEGPAIGVHKDWDGFGDIHGVRVDAEGKRFHVLHANRWWQLDVESATWSSRPIRSAVGLRFPDWNVCDGRDEIWTWDGGGGRVFRIDSTGTAVRMDNSFDHRNQYNHIQGMPECGNILIIGGQGLFTHKNFGIRFSNTIREWSRVEGMDLESKNPVVTGKQIAVHDPKRNRMLFHTQGADLNGYFLFDMDLHTGIIRPLHRLQGNWVVPETLGLSFFRVAARNKASSSHMIWASHSAVPENHSRSRLLVLDTETDRLGSVDAISSKETDPPRRHLALLYDGGNDAIYSLDLSHITNESTQILLLSKATVSKQTLKAATRRGYDAIEHDPRLPSPYRWVLWSLGLLVFSTGSFWIGYRLRRPPPANVPTPVLLTAAPLIRIHLDPELTLNQVRWSDRFGRDYQLEMILLELLCRAALNGQRILGSDTVDAALIPNHPSMDYIRKIRGNTRRRLEDCLCQVATPPNGDPFILVERDTLDKRKTKMQLNPQLVVVNPPK